MKIKRACPKCNSIDIFINRGKSMNQYGRFMISVFKAITFNRHICLQHGYIEEWVSNKKLLNTLDKMKSD